MDILVFPHPALLTPAVPVAIFGAELTSLLEEMYLTMQEAKGIGLAANQVGLDLNAFVMTGLNDEKLLIVNPVVIGQSRTLANKQEGCLSAPGDFVVIQDRAEWVVITYQNEKGEPQKRLFTGIHAVCVQHELEHLLGKAFIDSVTLTSATRKSLKKKWGLE